MTAARLAWLCLTALVLAGCTPDDQRTGSIKQEDVRAARAKLADAVLLHVDSGNSAFKANDYERALNHYREAVRLDDDVAAPWFGIYMAQRRLGNFAAADSALERAQKIAPGATLLRPGRPEPQEER